MGNSSPERVTETTIEQGQRHAAEAAAHVEHIRARQGLTCGCPISTYHARRNSFLRGNR